MDYELRFQYQGRDQVMAIPEGEIVIGRKEYCDLCLIDGGVSKRHARITRRGSRLELSDAGSRNGTLLNGQAVTQAELHPGDVIQVGTIALTIAEALHSGSMLPVEDEFELLASGAKFSGSVHRAAAIDPAADFAGASGEILEGEEERIPSSRPTARLRVFDGVDVFEQDCYPEQVVTMGTKEGNVVLLRGEGISRYHAEMYHDGTQWVVKDLGSRNGVHVKSPSQKDGERITVHALQTGDEIQIGTCRLRFETLRGGGPDLSQALQDPRAKVGLAAVVVIAVLLLLLPAGGGGGGGAGGGQMSYDQALVDGVKNIQQGNYDAAGQRFDGLARQFPDQKAPPLLARVATRWRDLNTPFAFDWDEAFTVLRDLQKEADRLPKFVRLWVDTQAERVKVNRDAFNFFKEARDARIRGDRLRQQRRILGAIKAYDEALELFVKISPKSEFHKLCQEQIRALRNELYELHYAEGEKYYKSGKSEWNNALRYFDKAQRYSEDEDKRFRLRRMMQSCMRNYEDERRYQSAVEIVQSRNWQRYPEALDLLNDISSSSFIHTDAKAYVEWIQADLKVREATRAYEVGNSDMAERLMREVLNIKVLGPDARRGVQQRLVAWQRVITAYNEGREAYLQGAGSFKRARNLLGIVTREETNPKNYFRQRALRMIDDMRSAVQGNDRALAVKGVQALTASPERLGEALTNFEQLRRSKTGRPYLAKISRIVEKVARERRWFHKAYWDVLLKRDLSRYQWASDVFYLLKEYLPADNASRKEAARNYEKIDEEIRRLGERFSRPREG